MPGANVVPVCSCKWELLPVRFNEPAATATPFKALAKLEVIRSWAVPDAVIEPPVMTPLASVIEPVGFVPVSVSANVAPVLLSVVEMLTAPPVWFKLPILLVVSGELKFRIPPVLT